MAAVNTFSSVFPGGESGKSSQDDVVEYFCKTDKKLVMQPAVLVEKMVMAAVEPCTGTGILYLFG